MNNCNNFLIYFKFLEHKLKPFHGAKICFSGFTEEEKMHMIEVLMQNGGTPIDDENDAECTHLVNIFYLILILLKITYNLTFSCFCLVKCCREKKLKL